MRRFALRPGHRDRPRRGIALVAAAPAGIRATRPAVDVTNYVIRQILATPYPRPQPDQRKFSECGSPGPATPIVPSALDTADPDRRRCRDSGDRRRMGRFSTEAADSTDVLLEAAIWGPGCGIGYPAAAAPA